MENFLYKLILFFVIVVLLCGLLHMNPFGRFTLNSIDYVNHKIDEATNYELKKTVEDTCRSMMASYTADKHTWQQYRSSESSEQRGWADQAFMRANRTAASYNEYVMKNSYVWRDNVPGDIMMYLPYLEVANH